MKRLVTALLAALALVAVAATGASADQERARSGPMLLGVARPAHILTPSATVRRIVKWSR